MRWSLLLAAYASHLVLGLLDNARGPLFPRLLADLGLSDARGALLFTVTAAFCAVGGLGGRWVRRAMSLPRALHLGLLLFAAGAAALGAAGGLGGLLLGAACYGLAIGLLSLAQAEAVDAGSPPAAHRRVFGGLHAMYGLSSLASPLLVTALARAGLGWQATFFLLAAAPVLCLLATAGLAAPPPRPAAPPPRAGGPPDSAPADGAPADGAPADDAPLGRQALFALILAAYCAAEQAVSSRLPLHVERLGRPSEEGSLLLSAFFVGLLAGRVLVGVVPLPFAHRPLLFASGGLALAATVVGVTAHPAGLAASGLFMGPFYPVGQALLRDAFPRSFERAMGTTLAVVAVTIMATHTAVGLLSDAVGLARALWVVPGALAVALALVAVTARGGASPASSA